MEEEENISAEGKRSVAFGRGATGNNTYTGDHKFSLFQLFINLNELGGKQKSHNVELPLTKNELRQRTRLLNRVENDWITNVLEKSLHLSEFIELQLENRSNAVKSLFEDVQTSPETFRENVDTSIADVFIQQEAQTLLILGEPGGGKTTILLELAQKLIDGAKKDSNEPIPVVFILSSWRPKKLQKFADWIIHELKIRYKVSPTLGKKWVEDQRMLLLLDGLDEVKAEFRKACVNSLQQFLNEYNLTEIVVCSRVADYDAISIRLEFQRAIYIQPLTLEKINHALEIAGNQLESVKKLLETDTVLQELSMSPLILNVIALAYHGITFENLPELDSIEERKQHLFNKYIEQMLKRKVDNLRYSKKQTIHWLTWLAQRMYWEPESESQTIFSIEQMQPNWLKLSKEKQIYHIGLKLRAGIRAVFISAVLFIGCSLIGSSPSSIKMLISLLGYGLLFGIIPGVIAYAHSSGMTGDPVEDSIETVETLQWSWERALRGLRIGLPIGILTGLSYGFGSGWILGTLLPTQYGGIASGIAIGVISGLILGLAFGLNVWLDEGFSGPRIEKKVYPNQGIKQSGISAIILASIGGLIVGFLSLSLQGSFLASILGLCFIFNKAGDAVIKHFILRISLYANGKVPWDLYEFLEYSKDRTFLHRVGGSYKFYHRAVMEYFASLEPDPVEQQLIQIKNKTYLKNKYLSQKYAEILEICQSLLKVTGDESENITQNLVKLYYTRKIDTESESLESEVLELLRNLIDENHLEIATQINNIGVFYYGQENYSESESLYHIALELFKHFDQQDNINSIICLNNLAQLHLTLTNYKEAKLLYERVLKSRKQLQNNNRSELIIECKNKIALINSTLD